MSKHTPGPWSVNTNKGSDKHELIHWVEADAHAVCDFYMTRGDGDDLRVIPLPNAEANARLIAAAPELLEALKDIKAEFQRLKQAVMDDEKMPLIAKMRDAAYLDGVLAVITTKSDAAIAKAGAA
jgi:hypothetical protein